MAPPGDVQVYTSGSVCYGWRGRPVVIELFWEKKMAKQMLAGEAESGCCPPGFSRDGTCMVRKLDLLEMAIAYLRGRTGFFASNSAAGECSSTTTSAVD